MPMSVVPPATGTRLNSLCASNSFDAFAPVGRLLELRGSAASAMLAANVPALSTTAAMPHRASCHTRLGKLPHVVAVCARAKVWRRSPRVSSTPATVATLVRTARAIREERMAPATAPTAHAKAREVYGWAFTCFSICGSALAAACARVTKSTRVAPLAPFEPPAAALSVSRFASAGKCPVLMQDSDAIRVPRLGRPSPSVRVAWYPAPSPRRRAWRGGRRPLALRLPRDRSDPAPWAGLGGVLREGRR